MSCMQNTPCCEEVEVTAALKLKHIIPVYFFQDWDPQSFAFYQ